MNVASGEEKYQLSRQAQATESALAALDADEARIRLVLVLQDTQSILKEEQPVIRWKTLKK